MNIHTRVRKQYITLISICILPKYIHVTIYTEVYLPYNNQGYMQTEITEMLLKSDLFVLLLCVCVDDPPTNITAVLGDTTTFRCHIQKLGSPVIRMYIQRVIKDSQEIFINGFDSSRKLDVHPEYQKRTKVNRTDLSMELTNVSISDEGLYKCVVFSDTMDKEMPKIHLKVTGKAQDTQTTGMS